MLPFACSLHFGRCRSYLPSGAQYRDSSASSPQKRLRATPFWPLRFDLAFLVTFFNQRKKCGSSGCFFASKETSIFDLCCEDFHVWRTFAQCEKSTWLPVSFYRDPTRTAQWALLRQAFLKRQNWCDWGDILTFLEWNKTWYGCFLKWWYPQNTSKWSF